MQLTNEQKADYAENGFLLLPDLIPEFRLAQFEARFVAFATGAVAPPPDETTQSQTASTTRALTSWNGAAAWRLVSAFPATP